MEARSSIDFFSPHVFEARRFVVEVDSKADFQVVSAGAERTAAGYTIDRKGFPYTGIEFVAAGHGTLNLAGKTIDLSPGVFFSYDRSVAHRIVTAPSERMVKYFVDITGRGARQLLARANLAPGTSGRSSVPDRIVSLFDELVRAGLDAGPHAPAVCRALVEAVVWRLSERFADVGRASSAAFENYVRCRRELERSVRDVSTIEDLAARCGVTPSYLCRLFKRFDSATPHQRLVRLRIAQAAGLLSGGRSIKQVARDLGYKNVFHFSRQFHEVFGTPPSHVRSTLPTAMKTLPA